MISKSTINLIASLEHKKYRDEHGLFVAEGVKLVSELRARLVPHAIFTVGGSVDGGSVAISEAEMKKISFLKTPSPMLGVFRIPQSASPIRPSPAKLMLALDGVQDPGNVGAIIRLCGWFGVDALACSPGTADCYSPKVVQASMGAVAHVATIYTDLPAFLQQAAEKNVPVYGTFLEGKSIYCEPLSAAGCIVVMGSEGRGISPAVARHISQRLYIPSFSAGCGVESLNVTTAAAVVCSELLRRRIGRESGFQGA
ncbi:MAG: RNA methyltransferase [Prevotellaceae bacterium]|jgi:TrmH family RNA methyltransferase|nr:RNA methyltransferase [Prevotellaceae bacterium]